jgi:uncharacterized protein YjdB
VTVTADVVALTGINLPPTLALTKGGQETLAVTYTPGDTTETGVTWITSDALVATVAGGTVTAVGGGTAVITATSTAHSGIHASCTVTVPVPLTGINLPSAITLAEGSTYILPAAYLPSDTTETGLTWSTSDTTGAVATVNATTGLIAAVGVGTAVITATSTAHSAISASCTVTVQAGYTGAGINIVFEGFTDETITLDVVPDGTDYITVTMPGGFDRYLWYWAYNSSGSTTTPVINLYAGPGLHYFTVIVDEGGNHFSKTLAYRVGY